MCSIKREFQLEFRRREVVFKAKAQGNASGLFFFFVVTHLQICEDVEVFEEVSGQLLQVVV